MDNRDLPSSLQTNIRVNIDGAEIVDEDPSVETRDIYLPKHTEFISHIALDIGGSLAKVVYFTRTNNAARPILANGHDGPSSPSTSSAVADEPLQQPPSPSAVRPNGFLGPKIISPSLNPQPSSSLTPLPSSSPFSRHMHRRRSSIATVPGGRLNFVKFETDQIDECISFISTLITSSSESHGVSIEQMKRSVKIMATGGGAHLYYDHLVERLGIEVLREEEMDCLITGLTFITEIPNEVFWYSDELVEAVSHRPPSSSAIPETTDDLPRPSPCPPQYSLTFDSHPKPQFPCMLVNIGSGVSIIKVDEDGKFERISGTSLGGGTLWGLLSLLTDAESFDEMLDLSERGDNSSVDMLVGDIYGSDYSKVGLKSSTIASSFGKVFRQGAQKQKKAFAREDISRSLLYAISNNIGQIAYMNAEKHNLDRIYFGGCFIRGRAATMSTLSYAIRFWSKGKKSALFLRHEGFLGSIGAWLKNLDNHPNHVDHNAAS